MDLTPFLIRPLWGPSISHFSSFFIFAIFRVFSFLFLFHTTISSIIFIFILFSHNHDAYELKSNYILTSTIFQNIISFTLIIFHNFQQSTQHFFFTLITTNITKNLQLICISSKHNLNLSHINLIYSQHI